MKMVRLFLMALLAAMAAFVAPTATADPGPGRPAVLPADASAEGAGYAQTILAKVNELRSSLGLKPVTRIVELDAIAQDWSEQMASRNSMEHRPNLGGNYPQGFTRATENVAWRSGGGDIGALIFEQWRNSPGHYANMTDPDVDSLGIGIAYDPGTGSWYATQNFANYGGDPVGKGLTASGGGSGQRASGSGAENVENAAPRSATESTDSAQRTSRSGQRKQSETTTPVTPAQEDPEPEQTTEAVETPTEASSTPPSETVTPTPSETVSSTEPTPTPSAPSSSATPVAATVSDGSVSPIIWMGAGALTMIGAVAATMIIRRFRLHR